MIAVQGPMIPVTIATARSERLGISFRYDLCVMNDDKAQAGQGECIDIGQLDPSPAMTRWPENGYYCLGLVEMEEGDEPPIKNTKRFDGILLLPLSDGEGDYFRAGWFFGFANFLNHSTQLRILIK
jgi:hypothetical protein